MSAFETMNPHSEFQFVFHSSLRMMKQSYSKIYNSSCESYKSTEVSLGVHESSNFASDFAFKTAECYLPKVSEDWTL